MTSSPDTAMPSLWLLKTAAFLNEIGIVTRLVDKIDGFLPCVRIVKGELEFTAQCEVSDILHEAGHIATVPLQFRAYLDGDVSPAQRKMLKEVSDAGTDPDEPLYRAVIQCSDPEATAWGWAAANHIGIPLEMRILDHHFDNGGADQRMGLELGHHFGIHGLSHAGFCVTSRSMAKHTGRPLYPNLAFWTQPVIQKQGEPERWPQQA